MTDIKKLINDFQKHRDEFIKTMKTNLNEYLKALIQDDVEAIRWTQYTPYFNDGDECVFRVNEPYVKFKTLDSKGGDDDGFYSLFNLSSYYLEKNKKEKSTMKQIEDALGEIPDFIMKEVLGNHIEVTITADGIETEEYNHD